MDICNMDTNKTVIYNMDINPDTSKTDVGKTDISKMDINKTDFSSTDTSKTDIIDMDISKTDISNMDVNFIMEIIPHRYPFLLVDRLLELDPGNYAVGLKNVSVNEYYFKGHFPADPVMPGVLQVEALAQVGALVILSLPENRHKNAYFTGINKFRFRQMVRPGTQLTMRVDITRIRKGMGKGLGEIKADGRGVAEGELMFAIV